MKESIDILQAKEVLDLVARAPKALDEMVDNSKFNLPNIPFPTMGGIWFWEDLVIDKKTGWRLQQHTITKHVRILDDQDVRRAWGSLEGMLKIIRRRKSIESEFGNKED